MSKFKKSPKFHQQKTPSKKIEGVGFLRRDGRIRTCDLPALKRDAIIRYRQNNSEE